MTCHMTLFGLSDGRRLSLMIRPAVAQTFIPSQPGPNKYGPNPQEVPQ